MHYRIVMHRNMHCERCHELKFHGDVPIEDCQSEWCLLARAQVRPVGLVGGPTNLSS